MQIAKHKNKATKFAYVLMMLLIIFHGQVARVIIFLSK